MSNLEPTPEQAVKVPLDDGSELQVFQPNLFDLKTADVEGTTFPVTIEMDPAYVGMTTPKGKTTPVYVWVAFDGVYAIKGNDGKYTKHETNDAILGNAEICFEELTLGYPVRYESSLTGASGIPTGTFYTSYDAEYECYTYTITAEDPTLPGYRFLGWSYWEGQTEGYLQNGSTDLGDDIDIDGPIVLTAMWEKVEETQTHTVSFVADVTGVSQLPDAINVEHDTVIPGEKVPTVPPIREGYNFLHWTDDLTTKAEYNFTQKITADVKLYPVWARNQVKITWPLNVPTGVTLKHQGTGNPADTVTSVDVGTEVTLQIVLDERYEIGTVKAGDRVLGSTVNGDIYTYTFTADKDLTVAVGDPTVKKFTISLPQGDGYEATFTDCKKYSSMGFGSPLTEADGATSYTFEYGDSFKIKLEAYADTTATLRVDGEEKFKVDGNSAETEKTTEEYTVNKMYNITVGTKRKITRMVTFSLEPYGGLYTIMPVENGSKIYAPAKPEIPGYEFGGWYKDAKFAQEWKFLPDQDATLTDAEKEAQTNAADVVKGNIVIYGKLTPKTYAVNYDANANGDTTVNGIPDAQTKTHGVALPLTVTNPTRDGHTFKGWATSAGGPVAYQPGGQYLNDAPVTLYAVWEKLTYTVTISSGAGYSTVPAGVATVNWHDPFTFTVNVDRQYAAKAPEVVDSVEGTLTAKTGEVNHTGATSYTYEIGKNHKIEQNRNITITVTQNAVHQVSFKVSKVTPGANGTSSTVTEQAPFLIQSVEHGYYASMPAAPEREGFKFKGYYKEDNTAVFPFNDAILADTTVHAVYEAIQPKITVVKVKDAANGWELKDWQHGSTGMTSVTPTDNTPFTIAYGDDVTFNLVIQPGYDYSKLSVSANGYELGRESIKTENGITTISFRLVYVTANTRITVSGIERKTITVTYNENALDHVSNLPAPQTANYYISGDRNNTDFTKQVPVRNGYTFLGWALSGTATTPNYKIDDIKQGLKIPFTADTTVYAIWAAKDLSAELLISDEFINSSSSAHQLLDYAYEGERIYLTGKLSAPAQGTMTFYKRLTKPGTIWVAAEDWTLIGTATVNGSQYGTIETTAEPYRWDNLSEVHAKNYRWDYKVVFTPANEEGYKECTGHDDLRVYSKAISWAVTKKTEANWSWVDAQNKLTIYTNEARTDKTTTMTANNTYWLQIPQVIELDGGLNLKNNKDTYLTVGQHYEIIWEYQDSENHWTTYTTTTDTDWVKVTPEFSGYTFRAKVKPSASSIYTKAATYTDVNALVLDVYWDYLITAPTNATVVKATKTELSIEDAENESNSIVIKDETPFDGLSGVTHKAQFEGQTITLTAKVTKTDETTAVNMGTVEFYRQVTGENDTTSWVSIGTAKLEDEGTVTGEASIEFQMPKYVAGKTPLQNKEVFKAVYVQNVTYKTSTSGNSEAYIKSAQLQIPVIADADSHKGYWLNGATKVPSEDADKTETTYLYHLGGLMAGIPHTFELKKTAYADGATADYSVVARDGRAVPEDMYTMKWETLTDANWKTTTTTGTTYTAETTKVGDRYHILLTGAKNSPFDGSEAVSKDIAIGDPQGVTVTVEAIDAIKATKVDRNNDKYPDVYQLNEITLTATVEAAEAGADRKPTGTVAFYYVDEDGKFQPLGEAELIKDKSGKMVAQITTDELPVKKKTGKNTNLTSVITAVYYGDETFKPSENWEEKEVNGEKVWTITSAEGANQTIQTDKVTVYSSVVYNCTDENTLDIHDGERGIHISKADGLFQANESATLMLSDVYTLDWELDDDLRDIVAKLNPNKDYTVQWQKLTGATATRDFANSERWEDITGATGTTLLLKPVEQDTAYRAVITVKDPATPIVKGSFELVDQAVKGRQVYYSNVMMPTSGETTIAVAVNTNERGDNLEGITEGETVTVNVLVSGAVGAVPNATLNVTIEADDTKGNMTGYEKTFTAKATVDGWNAFEWDTVAEQVQPGFYTLTVVATSNTGYMTETITRSIIVRESSYKFNVSNLNPTYNGRTQGVSVTLDEFHFNGSDIDAAAAKSWTVKYYDATGKLVEPSQAGTYTAKVTLPASAYWTEKVEEFTFTIEQRKVYVEDAVAQAKVYDGKTNVNLVEVILNDAVTDQTTNGTGLPTGNTGIINGDSIYATATGTIRDANAGENKFTVSNVELLGDDADNYVVDGTKTYEESIYVSRSQVYGETGTLKLKQGDTFPAADVIKMIDQSGSEPAYTLTFYYHSDTKIEKTEDLSKTGLYTVVARPKQDNYKGGVTMKFEVIDGETTYTPAAEPKPSTLIDLTNTATMYNPMGNVGVTATSSQGNTVEVKYQNGTDWSTDVPANAGRYLVKATDAISGDVAYGIYTITKAHPEISVTPATDLTYNSMQQAGYTALRGNTGTEFVDWYVTYAGDVAIGFDTPTDGNVAEQAPVDAGSYVVTLHVNETQNYTAHEVSAPFVIAQKPLTITTHSKQSTQYDAFPAMTAKYEGLAYSTSDNTNDTSLRDVQIAPEFLFNYDKGGFTNHALDQVGGAKIKPADALAKNYVITYVDGEYTRQRTNFKPDLAIYGLPVNGNGENVAYYGDEVQLYHYGYYTDHENGSSVMRWSVKKVSFEGEVTVGEKTGILNVKGVGTFTVKLTRGEGEQAISTTVTVTASKKELGVHLLDQDKVYTGSNQDYTGTVTVYDELYKTVAVTPDKGNLGRTNIGTQLPSGQIPAAETYYQSLIYRGKYTINDKEATVEPKEDTHIYGEYRKTKGFDVSDPAAISNVQTASQTDEYNRLDVHDGYEILVAGTEDMNYNVKYKTDHNDPAKDAADSKVATYGGVKFTSETKSKTTAYLNDATVYGETPNVLDWTLEKTIKSSRGGEPYADNLADFDLESIFVEQDYDNCVGNADCGKFDYKAANRTTEPKADYNKAVLDVVRTATDTAKDENYTLKFKTVINSGAENYKLTNDETGNATGTTKALKDGSLGFVPAAGESGKEGGENFVEGSANIAQRPVTVKKASTIGPVRLYWRLPQSKLYTALLNILEAEENTTNRGLAKGHTIKDLDLKIYVQDKLIDPNNDDARSDLIAGPAQVRIEVGDTNYVLDGNGKIDDVELKAIQIEATYTTKTATNFVVLIKIRNQDKSTTPLESAAGLTYEILRKVNGSFDGKVYATGSLTYTGRTATDKFGDECGVFTASYGPLSNIGGTYFIQMYEYGVALQTKNS